MMEKLTHSNVKPIMFIDTKKELLLEEDYNFENLLERHFAFSAQKSKGTPKTKKQKSK